MQPYIKITSSGDILFKNSPLLIEIEYPQYWEPEALDLSIKDKKIQTKIEQAASSEVAKIAQIVKEGPSFFKNGQPLSISELAKEIKKYFEKHSSELYLCTSENVNDDGERPQYWAVCANGKQFPLVSAFYILSCLSHELETSYTATNNARVRAAAHKAVKAAEDALQKQEVELKDCKDALFVESKLNPLKDKLKKATDKLKALPAENPSVAEVIAEISADISFPNELKQALAQVMAAKQ